MAGYKLRSSKSLGNFYFLNEKNSDDNKDKESLLGNSNKVLAELNHVPCSNNISHIAKNIVNNANNIVNENIKKNGFKKIQDIIRSEPPQRIPPPKQPPFKWFRELKNFIQILLFITLSLILFPIIGFVIIFLVFIPRLIFSFLIWAETSRDLQIIPLADSFKATGSEFYTVIHVIRGECNMDKIRNQFNKAVNATDENGSSLKYPKLRKRVVKYLGFYCFEDHKEIFDIENHVNFFDDVVAKIVDLKGISQSKLFSLLQDDFEFGYFKDLESYDEVSPQWEVLVVPKFYYDSYEDKHLEKEGVEDDRNLYALVYRANSAILDKATALKILQEEIIELSESGGSGGPLSTITNMSNKYSKLEWMITFFFAILLYPLLAFTSLFKIHKQVGNFRKPFDNIDKEGNEIISRYSLTSTSQINLPMISTSKNLTRTTVTSLLTSCTASAVRNLILGYNLQLPEQFIVTMRSFLIGGKESICNIVLKSEKFTFPLDRLHDAYFTMGSGNKIVKLTIEAKKICNWMLLWTAGAFPAIVGSKIYKWIHKSNIILEIWPGVQESYTVFGTDSIVDVFAWSSIAGTCADFGVTFTSYAGRLRANFIRDNEGLGYKTRRDYLVKEFTEEYLNIAQVCNLKPGHLDSHEPVTFDQSPGYVSRYP